MLADEGARQRVDQYRRSGELKAAARQALAFETVQELRVGLEEVAAVLDGRPVAPRRTPEPAESK